MRKIAIANIKANGKGYTVFLGGKETFFFPSKRKALAFQAKVNRSWNDHLRIGAQSRVTAFEAFSRYQFFVSKVDAIRCIDLFHAMNLASESAVDLSGRVNGSTWSFLKLVNVYECCLQIMEIVASRAREKNEVSVIQTLELNAERIRFDLTRLRSFHLLVKSSVEEYDGKLRVA